MAGLLTRLNVRMVVATSSLVVFRPYWDDTTSYPSACSGGITLLKHEPSAQMPWAKTMLGLVCLDMIDSFPVLASRLIHSRTYGGQWRSSTPATSREMRNRTLSTSTSDTSSRSTHFAPCARMWMETESSSSARIRPANSSPGSRPVETFSILNVMAECLPQAWQRTQSLGHRQLVEYERGRVRRGAENSECSERSSLRGSAASEPELVDSECGDLRIERLSRDSEPRGRAGWTRNPASRLSQRSLDHFPLPVRDRAVQRPGRHRRALGFAGEPRLIHRERLAIREDDGALDHVLKLPDIPRP